MADMKISDLPAAPNVNDAQQFEVNDSGNSRRVTFQMLRAKIKEFADSWYAPKTHTHPVTQISGATATGQALMTASNANVARAAIGAGTSNLTLGTTSGTAKPGDWLPNISSQTTGQLPYSRISGAPSGGPNLPTELGVGCWQIARLYQTFTSITVNIGETIAGSSLRVLYLQKQTSADGSAGSIQMIETNLLAGTWKNMGPIRVKSGSADMRNASFFMRIA